MNTNAVRRWICAKCGRIVDLSDYFFDDEELINLLQENVENYPQLKELLQELTKTETQQVLK